MRFFTSALLLAAAGAGVSALGPLGGVNMAGFDFTVHTNGTLTGTHTPPPISQFTHFASQGVNLFRIPFAWQLMTPTLGNLSTNFLSEFEPVVTAALNTGAYVILDLHNYARWNGGVINEAGGPSINQFASVWRQLAAKYKSESKIMFGLMNEPHDFVNNSHWRPAVQLAVNAIRGQGANSQYILIPGTGYSSIALPSGLGPDLLNVYDPVNATDHSKLVFDVHKYLDNNSAGTSGDCTQDGVSDLKTLSTWLLQHGRQAILSETGGGRNSNDCFTNLSNELEYVKSNPSTLAGFAIWSAGAFSTSYALSVTPNSDGSDAPLWTNAVRPNLP